MKILGRIGPGHGKIGKFLKRAIEWDEESKDFTWSADPAHVGAAAEALGMTGRNQCKGSATPGSSSLSVSDEKLNEQEHRLFRSVAGIVSYTALDRPDIQYSLKFVMNEVAAPTEQSMNRLRRIVRYLIRHPVLKWRFPRQPMVKYVDAFGDSDWAGEHGEVHKRRSTTCVVERVGAHVVETVSVAAHALLELGRGRAVCEQPCCGRRPTDQALHA